MEQGYLIDSNVIIGYLDDRISPFGMQFLHPIVDQTPKISIINKIEVLRFNEPPEKDYQTLVNFVNECVVFNLNDSIVDLTISICKTNRIKLPDAIIAATAIAANLTLLTRNTVDFKGISNLKTLNPWEIMSAKVQ